MLDVLILIILYYFIYHIYQFGIVLDELVQLYYSFIIVFTFWFSIFQFDKLVMGDCAQNAPAVNAWDAAIQEKFKSVVPLTLDDLREHAAAAAGKYDFRTHERVYSFLKIEQR